MIIIITETQDPLFQGFSTYFSYYNIEQKYKLQIKQKKSCYTIVPCVGSLLNKTAVVNFIFYKTIKVES